MFGIGMQELMIILLVALVVIGPKKLPEVARTIAKGVRELRKASDDLRHSIMFDEEEARSRYTPQPPKRLPPRSASDGTTTEKATGEPGTADGAAPDGEKATEGVPPQITGSLLTGAGASTAVSGGAPRDDGRVARGDTLPSADDDGPDPLDADDHRGMPFGPGSPELDDLIAKAKARQARDHHRRTELPRTELPRTELPRTELPRTETHRTESGASDEPKPG